MNALIKTIVIGVVLIAFITFIQSIVPPSFISTLNTGILYFLQKQQALAPLIDTGALFFCEQVVANYVMITVMIMMAHWVVKKFE